MQLSQRLDYGGFTLSRKSGAVQTYHSMSGKHLHRYVDEFAGRHNIRRMDTLEQMSIVARGLDRKRLRYKDLVA